MSPRTTVIRLALLAFLFAGAPLAVSDERPATTAPAAATEGSGER